MFLMKLYIFISLFCTAYVYSMEEKKETLQPESVELKQIIQGTSYVGKEPKEVTSVVNYGTLNLKTEDPIERDPYLEMLKENQKNALPLVIVLLETKNDKGESIFKVAEAYNYLKYVLSQRDISLFDFFSGTQDLPNLAAFKDVVSKAQLVSYPLVFAIWPGEKNIRCLGRLNAIISYQPRYISHYLNAYWPYTEDTTSNDIDIKLNDISWILRSYEDLVKNFNFPLEKSQQIQESTFRLLKINCNIPEKFISYEDINPMINANITQALYIFIFTAYQIQEPLEVIKKLKKLVLDNKSKLNFSAVPLLSLSKLLNTQPKLQDEALKVLDEIDESERSDPFISDELNSIKIDILLQKKDFNQIESLTDLKSTQKGQIVQAFIDVSKEKNPRPAIEKLKNIINQDVEWVPQPTNEQNIYFMASVTLAEIYLLIGKKEEAKKIIETIQKRLEYLRDPYLFYRAQKIWSQTHTLKKGK